MASAQVSWVPIFLPPPNPVICHVSHPKPWYPGNHWASQADVWALCFHVYVKCLRLRLYCPSRSDSWKLDNTTIPRHNTHPSLREWVKLMTQNMLPSSNHLGLTVGINRRAHGPKRGCHPLKKLDLLKMGLGDLCAGQQSTHHLQPTPVAPQHPFILTCNRDFHKRLWPRKNSRHPNKKSQEASGCCSLLWTLFLEFRHNSLWSGDLQLNWAV